MHNVKPSLKILMAIGRLTRIGLTGFNWRMRWKNESENRQSHQRIIVARRDVFVDIAHRHNHNLTGFALKIGGKASSSSVKIGITLLIMVQQDSHVASKG